MASFFFLKKITFLNKKKKGRKKLYLGSSFFSYTGTIPDFKIWELIYLQFQIWKIDGLARTINLKNPQSSPNASYLDSMSAKEWILKNLKFSSLQRSILSGLVCVFTSDIGNISMLWLLFYIHSAGGILQLLDYAQTFRFRFGAQQVFLKQKNSIQPFKNFLNLDFRRVVQNLF